MAVTGRERVVAYRLANPDVVKRTKQASKRRVRERMRSMEPVS